MSKSNYTHHIESHAGKEIVVIEDLDLGGMSVTNNIETIVEEISLMEKINITPDSHLIVYMDSTREWSGWHMDKGFTFTGGDTWEDAADAYITKLR